MPGGRRTRARFLAVALVLCSLLATACAPAVRRARAPQPEPLQQPLADVRRILVSVELGALPSLPASATPAAGADAVAGHLVARLAELRLEGTVDTGPGPDERHLTLAERARARGFGLVLHARLDVVAVLDVPGAGRGGAGEYFGLQLQLELVDSERAHRTAADPSGLYVVESGASASDAVASAADRLTSVALAPLTVALAAQPRFAHLLERDAYDEAARQVTEHAQRFREALTARSDLARGWVERERADESGARVELLTDPLGEAYHVGDLDREGTWLMLRERHFATLLFATSVLEVRAESEELVVVSADGSTRRLEQQLEFDAFPVLAADGHSIVVGTRRPGGPGELVVLDARDGQRRVLRELGRDESALATITADGRRVLYRLTRGALTELRVIDVESGEDRQLVGPHAHVGAPEPSADGRVAWVATGTEHRDTILRIDLETGTHEAVLGWRAGPGRNTAPDGERDPRYDSWYSYAIPLPDGSGLIVSEHERDSHYLGRYELATGEYRRLAPLRIERRIELSPDGRQVAIDVPGSTPGSPTDADVELVLVDTSSGEVVEVTRNTSDDRLGEFSADGRTLTVRQAAPDPAGRLMTSRIYRYTIDGLIEP